MKTIQDGDTNVSSRLDPMTAMTIAQPVCENGSAASWGESFLESQK